TSNRFRPFFSSALMLIALVDDNGSTFSPDFFIPKIPNHSTKYYVRYLSINAVKSSNEHGF
ncbi:MAG: hypothetical protein ACM3JQ_00290, partial [Candidatus Eiseniibacteriota bacterium]